MVCGVNNRQSPLCINIYWVFSDVGHDGGLFELGGGEKIFTTALLVEVSSLKD